MTKQMRNDIQNSETAAMQCKHTKSHTHSETNINSLNCSVDENVTKKRQVSGGKKSEINNKAKT